MSRRWLILSPLLILLLTCAALPGIFSPETLKVFLPSIIASSQDDWLTRTRLGPGNL